MKKYQQPNDENSTPFQGFQAFVDQVMPERTYNPITAMGFSALFTFQLDNTKR